MRYYSTQRPVGPGTFPRLDGNKVVEIHNYDSKTYCEELGREAWGYIDYEQPLAPEDAIRYELTAQAPKVLYFEGAGWSGAEISKATIGNCRIRTAFHLDDGRAVYLEINGSERTKHSAPEIYQWQYTGFVDHCYYITDDKDNDDCNKHHVLLPGKRGTVEHNSRFEYTEAAILRLVNSLGASFDAIKVVPDLGGYRVFPAGKSCRGPDGYYYGDEFKYDPELTARREEVYRWAYDLELRELEEDRAAGGKRLCHSPSRNDYPAFSLWVDEHDPGLLHLLRHFVGYNKHWTIRVDAGETLDDWTATMTETHLGKYGC